MLPPGRRVLLKELIDPDRGRCVVQVVQYQVLLDECAGRVLGQVLILVASWQLAASL
jgi:hypothetical protein